MKPFLIGIILSLALVACGGGGSSTPPPLTQTTYGVFRANRAAAPTHNSRVIRANDPPAGTADMSTPRAGLTATLLPNGQVLLAGGTTSMDYQPYNTGNGFVYTGQTSMDLFDPTTESFSTPLGNGLIVPRFGHAALVLGTGQVLFVGGDAEYRPGSQNYAGPGTLETYDPTTGQSAMCGSLNNPSNARTGLVAYLLPDGRVLALGGNGCQETITPMLLDPATFSPSATSVGTLVPLPVTVYSPGSCQLQDGRVLVSGGMGAQPNPGGLAGATVSEPYVWAFDPATDSWSTVGTMDASRTEHNMIDLGNGTVAVIGGGTSTVTFAPDGTTISTSTTAATEVEVFNYTTGVSVASGTLPGPKVMTATVALQNGFTLSAGGVDAYSGSSILTQTGISESQMVANPVTGITGYTGTMITPRLYFGMTPLSNGLILLSGGEDSTGTPLASAEIYDPQDHVYLTYPSAALAYGAQETMTATPATGVNPTGTPTWSATYGVLTPAADGMSATYTYPAQPQAPPPVNGVQQPAPVIAFDTVTFTFSLGAISGPQSITAVISLVQ
jgi:hypothetical protein